MKPPEGDMSDNWIIVIPEDPQYLPEAERQSRACKRLSEMAPCADQIESKVCDEVTFFDCGANFERVLCPDCRTDISLEWWQSRMDDDYRKGFKVARYATPCCGSLRTLHELDYDWAQGFGRFALQARNPNIGKLDDSQKEELETILGTKLRAICRSM